MSELERLKWKYYESGEVTIEELFEAYLKLETILSADSNEAMEIIERLIAEDMETVYESCEPDKDFIYLKNYILKTQDYDKIKKELDELKEKIMEFSKHPILLNLNRQNGKLKFYEMLNEILSLCKEVKSNE